MSGIELIAQERQRQVVEEGWTEEHDATMHGNGELALVAALYAMEAVQDENVFVVRQEVFTRKKGWSLQQNDPWPWAAKWDKRDKHDNLRKLTIAGALIAAEIDRLMWVEKSKES